MRVSGPKVFRTTTNEMKRATYDQAYVEKPVERLPWTGCWVWMQRVDKDGYGSYGGHGKNARAHRLAFRLWKGPIPLGRLICHSCDTPACVNPDHLSLGTDHSNSQDKVKRGRQPRGEAAANVKLTEDDVRAIRASKEPQKKCGARYGIGQMQVSRIRRGMRWAHIN